MSDLIHEIRAQIDLAICRENMTRRTKFRAHLHKPYSTEDVEVACKVYHTYWHVDISGCAAAGWVIDLRKR